MRAIAVLIRHPSTRGGWPANQTVLAVNVLWQGPVFAWSVPGRGLVLIVTMDLLVIATMAAFARWDALAPTLLAPCLVCAHCPHDTTDAGPLPLRSAGSTATDGERGKR